MDSVHDSISTASQKYDKLISMNDFEMTTGSQVHESKQLPDSLLCNDDYVSQMEKLLGRTSFVEKFCLIVLVFENTAETPKKTGANRQ